MVAVAHDDNDTITVSWEQPPDSPPVTSTTVTFCPTSSPNCGKSVNCTSPCTFRGLDPDTEYQFTVVPNNNCASRTGCPGSSVTAQITTCKYSMTTYWPMGTYVLGHCMYVLANMHVLRMISELAYSSLISLVVYL